MIRIGGNAKRSVLVGSYHQGDCRFQPYAGKQCVPNVLMFFCYAQGQIIDRFTALSVDQILANGNSLYEMIHKYVYEDYLSIDDLPRMFTVAGVSYEQKIIGSRTGYVHASGSVTDNLKWAFTQSDSAFFLCQDKCVGLKKDKHHFYLFDSHSNSKTGKQQPNGAACVIKFDGFEVLVKHLEILFKKRGKRLFEVAPSVVKKVTSPNHLNYHVSPEDIPSVSAQLGRGKGKGPVRSVPQRPNSGLLADVRTVSPTPPNNKGKQRAVSDRSVNVTPTKIQSMIVNPTSVPPIRKPLNEEIRNRTFVSQPYVVPETNVWVNRATQVPSSCCKEVVLGSFHQGDPRFSPNSGKQCVANVLSYFLSSTDRPVDKTTSVGLDNILVSGNSIYDVVHKIVKEDYLHTGDLPKKMVLSGIEYSIEINDSRNGLVNLPENTLFTLTWAFSNSNSVFMVCQDKCIGLKYSCGFYYLFDSHSNSSMGKPAANGSSCLLKFRTFDDMCEHIPVFFGSSPNTFFEVTPCHIQSTGSKPGIRCSIKEGDIPSFSQRALSVSKEVADGVSLSNARSQQWTKVTRRKGFKKRKGPSQREPANELTAKLTAFDNPSLNVSNGVDSEINDGPGANDVDHSRKSKSMPVTHVPEKECTQVTNVYKCKAMPLFSQIPLSEKNKSDNTNQNEGPNDTGRRSIKRQRSTSLLKDWR